MARGCMSFTARLDWLQGKITFPSYDRFWLALNSFLQPLGDRWSLGDSWFCGESYEVSILSPCGFRGGYNLLPNGLDCLLQFQGNLLSCLDSQQQYDLVYRLVGSGFRATRCDIALDDFDRRINPRKLRSIGFRGAYRLLDSYKCIEETLVRGCPPIPTSYFGKSDKIVRFYDAEFVHGLPADRWELQLRRDVYPDKVLNDYLDDPECLASFVVGAIDFGKSSTGHYRDFRRYQFWQSLIDEVSNGSPRPLNGSPLEPDIFRSMGWLSRQGGVTLAVLREGMGSSFDDWIESVCSEGELRMRDHHHNQVDILRERFGEVS